MYSIIETEDKYFVVPHTWVLTEKDKFCYPSGDAQSRSAAVKNCSDPEDNWNVYKILHIHESFGNYYYCYYYYYYNIKN